jgi:prepilin-type N-terminal cleavage/methylation domain-containing protein
MKNSSAEKGFTLVELIVVLSLLGIVSLTIIPKLDMSDFKESADIDTLISNTRYAQHKSMVSGNNWRVIILSSQNAYIIDNNSVDTDILPQIPGSDNPLDVSTSVSANVKEFYFDYLGRPVTKKNKLITSPIYVKIGSRTVVMEPYSGGIHVE